MGGWEQKNLVNELTRGKELATKLEIHLMNNASSSSWLEAHEFLVRRILASNEKALSMLNSATSIHFQDQEDSDAEQYPQDAFKKRYHVSVDPGIGLEGLPDDGYISDLRDQSSSGVETQKFESTVSFQQSESTVSLQQSESTAPYRKGKNVWRTAVRNSFHDGYNWGKYGQKNVLNSRYTRNYYRCTNKYDQGCLATKQVQQSDKDPTIFNTTYNGLHTCTQVPDKILSPDPQTIVTQHSDNPHQQTSSSFNFASLSDFTVETCELSPIPNLKTTHSIVSPEISGTSTLSVGEAEMGKFGSVHQNLSKPVTLDLFPIDQLDDPFPIVQLDDQLSIVQFDDQFSIDQFIDQFSIDIDQFSIDQFDDQFPIDH